MPRAIGRPVFVDGLHGLDAVETRRRLALVMAACRAASIEAGGDRGLDAILRRVEGDLLFSARMAVGELAEALAEHEAERAPPKPKPPPSRSRRRFATTIARARREPRHDDPPARRLLLHGPGRRPGMGGRDGDPVPGDVLVVAGLDGSRDRWTVTGVEHPYAQHVGDQTAGIWVATVSPAAPFLRLV